MNNTIQFLRGVSIIYILLLHSTFMWKEEWRNIYFLYFDTASGVELFFCIAGYFASKSIFINDSFSFSNLCNFLIKKIKRLSPSLYIWGGIAYIWGTLSDPVKYGSSELLYKQLIATFVYARNFLELESPHAFGYFWAVSLEMQFFIFFAIIVYLLNKNSSKINFIIAVIYMLLCIYRPGILASDYFRIDAMLLGVLVYRLHKEAQILYIIQQFDTLKTIYKKLILFILLICLASSLKVFESFSIFRITITSILAAIITILGVGKSSIIKTGVNFLDKVIIKIGDLSYSIYVVHIISWWIAGDILSLIYKGNNIVLTWSFYIIFMIVSAYINYKYVEKKF